MILTLVEHDRGAVLDTSLEALVVAREIAGMLETSSEAVVIGVVDGTELEALGAHGGDAIHFIVDERLDAFAPDAWADGLAQLAVKLHPAAVLASGTDRGNELMARVAARMDLPMAANCTQVDPRDPFVVTRLRWGGSLLEDAELTGTPKLLTIAPHTVRAEPVADRSGPVVTTATPAFRAGAFRVQVAREVAPVAGTVSLTDAKVVVGGGRGVGSKEGFAALEELAGLLGGAVGCSRVVTSAGWRPHSDQVGQTGVRIAPDLYIACGISGAIQHIVGCKAAKTILAINTDSEAPIVTKADYAVIGDLREVVPAIIAELRTALASER